MIIKFLLVGDQHEFELLLVRRLKNEISQSRLFFSETMASFRRTVRREINHIIVAERMGEDALDDIKLQNQEGLVFSQVHRVDPLNQAQIQALIRTLKSEVQP